MADLADLFPGFASRYFGTEAGRIFARIGGTGAAAGAAARISADARHVAPHRAGAEPRSSRSWRSTCAATAGPRPRPATPGRPTASAPWAATSWPSWMLSAWPASPARGTIAAPGSATAWRSTIRAASPGWRCSTSCPTMEVWRAIEQGRRNLAALAVPRRAGARARDGDRQGPGRLLRRADAQMGAGRRPSTASIRGRWPITAPAGAIPPAFMPSARITAPGATLDRQRRRGG